MTTKTDYAPGTPSWVDLATTDPAAAKTFYGTLFDWTYHDEPTGDPANPYTLAFRDGKVAAGLASQPPYLQSAPPMWTTYISVADIEASAKQVEPAGGSLIAPPFDVADAGRMSVAADPTGAVFSIWQRKNHAGAAIVNEPGAFSWNELLTADVPRAAAFYHELFGWGANALEMGPMQYTEFRLDDQPVAGGQPPPMPGIPPVWVVYFAVADTDATVAEATRLGAQVLAPPMDIPPGRIAVLTDPQGAVFNVIRLASPPD